MKKIALFIFLLLILTTAKSQVVEKVTSINYYGYNGLNPSNLTVFNDKLYFFGTDDPQYVDKLMYTDGTEAGVTVVKQIDTIKQYPTLQHLTILNNLFIFNNSFQLWRSDGTSGGTSIISVIKISNANFVVSNNKAYFAGDGSNSFPINDQLWQTDGTVAGTSLLKTINPTGAAGIFNLFSFGGKIYFGASDGVNNAQLWVSDGTANGTFKLKIINPTGIAYPSNFFAFNGKVYFSASDGVNGTQLWVTDGTTSGTVKVTNINAGPSGLQPSTFTLFNAKLFFMGIDTGNFYQLFSTDGTAAGTKVIKADHTPGVGNLGFFPASMAVHNNKLYMSGYDSISATNQLWVSDGTTAGTIKVTSFPVSLYASRLYSFQSRLIFSGNDTISGQEDLYASDGTALGTICPTPPYYSGYSPFYHIWEDWVPFNNALYYKAAYLYWADYQLCRYKDNSSGIEQQQTEKISVYPNPVNNFLTIVCERNVSSISILNQLGQIVFHSTINNEKSIAMDCSSFINGIYLAKIKIGEKVITQKFIVQH